MAKRKRSSAKTNGAAAGPAPSPANKRPRVDDAGVDADDDDLTTTNAKAGTVVHAAAAPVDSETEALLQDRSLFSETLSRADHDRELRLYRLLGSADVTDRLRAADVIVAALLGGEDAENGGGGGVPEAVLLRHLERRLLRGLASGNEAARVGFSYVLSELLGRLFGSGDPSSAPPRYPGLTFARVLALLLEKTRPAANVPGQEERDHYFGQLFGLQSFVESGVLFAGPAEDGDGDAGSRWRSVLGHLLQLGRKKVWLRAQACFVVVQAIARGRLPDEAAVQATLQTLAAADQGALAKTPEGLGIWLAAHARFPAMALAAPWAAPLAAGSYRELVAVLRHEDADAGGGGSGQNGTRAAPAVKQGNASAQLHFVWDLLLNAVLPRPGEPFGEAAAKQLDAFWTTVVDQVYFAKGASDHQKLTGFKIFQRALALCADRGCPIPPTLFSSNLMTCLMNQASNATPRLHRAAVQVLKTVEKQVEDKPAVLPQVLACLLGCVPRAHGVYDFDERVKGTGDGTKPVERILRCAGPDTIDAVVAILRKGALQVPDPNNEQKAIRKYTEYLFRLVGRVAPSNQDGPQQQMGRASVGSIAFQALAEIAYPSATAAAGNEKSSESSESSGKKKKKNKNKGGASSAAEDAAAAAGAPSAFPALSDKTRAASRQSLLSAAGALLRRPENVASFCRTVLAIEPSTVGVAMSDDIAAQIAQARQQLTRLAAAFAEAATADAAAARARQGLAVLMAVSLLQLYHEPRADAVEVLQDIEACSEKLEAYVKQQQQQQQQQGSGKKSNGKTNGTKGEAPAEPDIGQVLTDVLLALLAEASPLTRQTSLQVFEAFAPFLSTAALENLTDVLAAEENMAGYRALFNQEGDDEEDEEDDSGEDEDDDDDDSVVMMDMEADGDAAVLAGSDDDASEDSDSGSGSSDSSSDEDEAEDVDDAEQKKLEAALMKTLRVAHLVEADGGDGSDDSDGDSDDGSDMSDDAMLALDDQLARHLRLIKDRTGGNKKKDLDEARRKVVAFKHRVLDLLEAYVKHEGGGAEQSQGRDQEDNEPERVLRGQLPVIRLLLPLALAVRDTKDPALGQKAARIVQEAQRQLKKSRTAAVAVAASSSSSPSLVSPSSSSPSAEALALLSTLHTAANDRAESRAFAATVSTASLAVASALVAADRAAHYHRVADVYRATQDHWVLDGWSVRPSLFTDWYNWCQSVRAKN